MGITVANCYQGSHCRKKHQGHTKQKRAVEIGSCCARFNQKASQSRSIGNSGYSCRNYRPDKRPGGSICQRPWWGFLWKLPKDEVAVAKITTDSPMDRMAKMDKVLVDRMDKEGPKAKAKVSQKHWSETP